MFCLLPTSSRLPRSLCGSPQLEEAARFEAERGEELRKLQRDRRVLEKQSRAILKMPTKQSKEEVAAVEVRGSACRGARCSCVVLLVPGGWHGSTACWRNRAWFP
jgi:hypothetical protein